MTKIKAIKNLNPTGHRVMIQVDEVEETSKHGIILGIDKDREDQAQVTGILVAKGPTAWNDTTYSTPWAEIGDNVSFVRHAGFAIKVGGKLMRVMNDEDITGVIEYEDEE